VLVLGAAVVLVLGAAVVLVLGAAVSVAVAAAASVMICGGPNGVNARATATTRVAETAGYATKRRMRIRRTSSLFMRGTGNS